MSIIQLFFGSRNPGFFLNNAPVSLGGPGPVNVQNSAPFTLSTTSPITCHGNFNVSVKLRGAPGAGPVTFRGVGGVVTGTVFFADGQSYNVVYDPKYSALFYGINGSTAPVCIMLAAQGGGGKLDGSGSHTGYSYGGNAGTSGGNGTPWTVTGGNGGGSGGGGATTSGYLSGSGGSGGAGSGPNAPPVNGNAGGLFSPGPGGSPGNADGMPGGFGYYGGGGGGGYNGQTASGGGGGGGGSNYVGGLPGAAPYPVPVSSTSSSNEPGGVYIEFISIIPA